MISLKGIFSRSSLPQGVAAWADKHALRVVPAHSGEDLLRLSGRIQGNDFKIACGPPAKAYLEGTLALRAHLQLPLPDRLRLAVLNRGLRERLQDELFNLNSDDVQTRVAEVSLEGEEQMLAMMREVRVESQEFRKNFSLVCSRPKWSRFWLDESMERQFTAVHGLTGFHVPMVFMLRASGMWLHWRIKRVSLDYLRHSHELMQLAVERIRLTERESPSALHEDTSEYVV